MRAPEFGVTKVWVYDGGWIGNDDGPMTTATGFQFYLRNRTFRMKAKWTTLILVALLSQAFLGMAGTEAAGVPEKNITIVVPYPPGSSADAIPRLVGPLMSKSLGVPVIIENRGGANGSIGAVRVASSPADGSTR